MRDLSVPGGKDKKEIQNTSVEINKITGSNGTLTNNEVLKLETEFEEESRNYYI